MKPKHFALAGLLHATAAGLAAAEEHEQEPKHFINWDVLEHPVVETFKWERPFPDEYTSPMGFVTTCDVHIKLHAKQYKFREFEQHLKPWAAALRNFYDSRPYAGHWDGVNEGGENRDVIMMEWREVPKNVRDWIEEQQRTGKADNKHWTYLVFPKPKHKDDIISETIAPVATPAPGEPAQSVVTPPHHYKDKEKVVFFQAGQIYDILPLWVAHRSKCAKQMMDLSKYHKMATDGGTVAWVTRHTKPDKHNDISWKIRSETVVETEHARHSRMLWEKLWQNHRRQERRSLRQERQKEGERMKDEL